VEIGTVRELLKKEIAKGKKQIVLANEIGVSHGTIYKLLNTDTRPTTETLKKIADYFKVPLTNLIEPGERSGVPGAAGEKGIHRIPVVNRVRDASRTPKEGATEYLWLSHVNQYERTSVMVTTDDAMAPLIKKGDYVLFTAEETEEGDVVIVENEWTDLIVRRLRKRNQTLFLTTENPEYAPLPLTKKLRIVGKAVEVLSRRRI
jgi:SOS-response transcriptional repressor LexA